MFQDDRHLKSSTQWCWVIFKSHQFFSACITNVFVLLMQLLNDCSIWIALQWKVMSCNLASLKDLYDIRNKRHEGKFVANPTHSRHILLRQHSLKGCCIPSQPKPDAIRTVPSPLQFLSSKMSETSDNLNLWTPILWTSSCAPVCILQIFYTMSILHNFTHHCFE